MKVLFSMSILVLLTLQQLSCATKSQQENSFQEIRKTSDSNILRSFGFRHNNHNYNFIVRLIPCPHLEGYIDDRLEYSIEDENINKLIEIFNNQKLSVDQKINHTVDFLDTAKNLTKICKSNSVLKSKSTLQKIDQGIGDVLGFAIYGTMFVAIAPIAVPVIAADSFAETQLKAKLEKIQLGQTFTEISLILNSYYETTSDSDYIIQKYDLGSTALGSEKPRLIFVYQKNILIAYVWGYNK